MGRSRALVGLGSRFALCAALGLGSVACEQTSNQYVDGGLGRRLELVGGDDGSPPGQIGLRYAQSAQLGVRYVLEDPAVTAVTGEPVRFSIFDDPAGSTLSRDVVSTDDSGEAVVKLTAGNQEGSFRVRASAAGANDAELAISVSMLEFVQITAALSDALPGAGTHTLTAALYSDEPCSAIAPAQTLVGAARAVSADGTSAASLRFVNLLSKNYALVARVTAGNRLLGFGCIDIVKALAASGATLNVPVPISAVTPSVTGAFAVTSQIGTSRDARTDDFWSDVDVVDRCSGHVGQLILDELTTRVDAGRAALIAAARGTPVTTSTGGGTIACQPPMVLAATSLDAELGALLEAQSPGNVRARLIADLDELLASGVLASRFVLRASTPLPTDGPVSPTRLLADHLMQTVVLHVGTVAHTYDLAALGWPSLTAKGIAASTDAATLMVGTHSLAAALPELWGLGWGALSVTARLPSLPEPTFSAWLTASANAAQRNAKSGCAAIEDLICETTGVAGCAGTLVDACTSAVAATGARLDATFAGHRLLTLNGTATISDDDGDLVADRLLTGSWDATGPISSSISFSANRVVP